MVYDLLLRKHLECGYSKAGLSLLRNAYDYSYIEKFRQLVQYFLSCWRLTAGVLLLGLARHYIFTAHLYFDSQSPGSSTSWRRFLSAYLLVDSDSWIAVNSPKILPHTLSILEGFSNNHFNRHLSGAYLLPGSNNSVAGWSGCESGCVRTGVPLWQGRISRIILVIILSTLLAR